MSGEPCFLVDTSTWVLSLRKDGSPEAAAWLREALAEEKVIMAPLVKVELLLGSRDKAHYDMLEKELNALPQLPTTDQIYEQTAVMAFLSRSRQVASASPLI